MVYGGEYDFKTYHSLMLSVQFSRSVMSNSLQPHDLRRGGGRSEPSALLVFLLLGCTDLEILVCNLHPEHMVLGL